MRVAFGEFVFDDEIRELRRGAERLALSHRAFVLLTTLAHARPRVLSKKELAEELWPGSEAGEANLTGVVSELRRVLGEASRNTRFIKTVRNYGYAFGDGAEDPRGARARKKTGGVRLSWKGGRQELQPGAHVLGRGLDAKVVIDSGTVSRLHARLTVGGGPPVLEDLDSRNGTWFQGEEISAPVELEDGASFRLGSVKVKLKQLPPGG